MKSVREIMTKDVATVSTNDNIYEAAKKMHDLNVGFIPIVDDEQHLMGAVTDRDLVLRGYANKKSGSAPITEVMSDELNSVSPETSLQEASQIMADKQIRRLPVVENGKLVGIVSLGDLSQDEASDHAAGVALGEISERKGDRLNQERPM
ncbi:CBS domain protein [Melghiribacillus thermohalophilus]|uniref:CBS domain protein n=1 Tax=Melghiribacillus thermohalophilus TaxID=1324956 RepID=A0A4V2V2X4_9BACI|nr:CBS domain-containing protein [Melghiribacillus thermohalophilus]TCT26901.1 CBS domain protein [Melghiribacillus thermohalophilus]